MGIKIGTPVRVTISDTGGTRRHSLYTFEAKILGTKENPPLFTQWQRDHEHLCRRWYLVKHGRTELLVWPYQVRSLRRINV